MEIDYTQVNKIAFACDAGIGASVMGAAIMRNILALANVDVAVIAVAINKIDEPCDLIIVHQCFKDTIEKLNIKTNVLYINNYLDKDLFEEIGEKIINVK